MNFPPHYPNFNPHGPYPSMNPHGNQHPQQPSYPPQYPSQQPTYPPHYAPPQNQSQPSSYPPPYAPPQNQTQQPSYPPQYAPPQQPSYPPQQQPSSYPPQQPQQPSYPPQPGYAQQQYQPYQPYGFRNEIVELRNRYRMNIPDDQIDNSVEEAKNRRRMYAFPENELNYLSLKMNSIILDMMKKENHILFQLMDLHLLIMIIDNFSMKEMIQIVMMEQQSI